MCSVKMSGYSRRKVFAATIMLLSSALVEAQTGDGNAGISQATTLVKGYFATGTTLLYAIGAVVGLVGAVKVFNAWNSGSQETSKMAAGWFGSCIFLVVVATVLKSFFGV
jgi:hypothetical protein